MINKRNNLLKFNDMPLLRPLIMTNKSCCSKRRKWRIEQDWIYEINNEQYIIRRGFIFDGASVPAILKCCRSSTGILFIPSLIHDWGYQKQSLARIDNNKIIEIKKTRKELDLLFSKLVSDFKIYKYITFNILKIFGWIAWRKSKKLNELI